MKINSKGQFTAIDYSGYNHKDVIAIRPTDAREPSTGYIMWELRCQLCNETFVRASMSLRDKTATHRCKAWREKYITVKGRPPIPDKGSHINAHFGHYKVSARNRGHSFELTRDEFKSIIVLSCHYCGSEAKERVFKNLAGSFSRNGIDRVDSSQGYVLSNCVPCCRRCNEMKKDTKKHEFLAQVKAIYTHCKL